MQAGNTQLGTDPQHVQQLVRASTVRAANRAIAIDYVFLTRLSVQVEWFVAAATAFTKGEKHSEGRR